MARDRYGVQLAEEERERLTQLVRSGRSSARRSSSDPAQGG